jgi:hypothetical protein
MIICGKIWNPDTPQTVPIKTSVIVSTGAGARRLRRFNMAFAHTR